MRPGAHALTGWGSCGRGGPGRLAVGIEGMRDPRWPWALRASAGTCDHLSNWRVKLVVRGLGCPIFEAARRACPTRSEDPFGRRLETPPICLVVWGRHAWWTWSIRHAFVIKIPDLLQCPLLTLIPGRHIAALWIRSAIWSRGCRLSLCGRLVGSRGRAIRKERGPKSVEASFVNQRISLTLLR